MSVLGFALSWDRLLGALLGFMLAWVAYSVLNQVLWIPQAREAERSRLAADALQKTIEVIQSREKTNVEISAGDAVALCEHFGLQDDDKRECLRRVAEASAKP